MSSFDFGPLQIPHWGLLSLAFKRIDPKPYYSISLPPPPMKIPRLGEALYRHNKRFYNDMTCLLPVLAVMYLPLHEALPLGRHCRDLGAACKPGINFDHAAEHFRLFTYVEKDIGGRRYAFVKGVTISGIGTYKEPEISVRERVWDIEKEDRKLKKMMESP